LAVHWPDGERRFAAGERIHSENSYKYTLEAFTELLVAAGFSPQRRWLDRQEWFAVLWSAA
jgi:uncharacterized SAM-dependent methyltransferase